MIKRLSFPAIIIASVILSISAYLIIRGSYAVRFESEVSTYAGSESCRPCHEHFYQLWAPSYHGLAMQPLSGTFIEKEIAVREASLNIGESLFSVSVADSALLFTEVTYKGDTNNFRAVHVMGGKYIYYFLTEFDRGRLQVLPLAYDCMEDKWYNNPESGVRHFEDIDDAPLDWRSHLYTFNTTCYNCHVSQLESNFDLETLEYSTSWREPGINCETCHGPSQEHIRVCVRAGEGNVPDDLKIIMTSEFTAEQNDASCGSCHGKSSVIATGFSPGDSYYDYFDLVTLENPDFYPDGRDLGENYTMTTWEMNKCKEGGGLDCVTCHTSSGRYRFATENRNGACAPCHNDKIENPVAHTFHNADGEGSICISCHMPKTTFARMDRSDHSFRPPMPSATIEFGSPNACNICHTDNSPEWADRDVKEKHGTDYQEEVIYAGQLIRQARQGDWENLEMILDGLDSNRFDMVFTTSFIRLLEYCGDERKWNSLIARTGDISPLVRGAAAHSLFNNYSEDAYKVLVKMLEDDFRLVRLNAAYALSNNPYAINSSGKNPLLDNAIEEYRQSLISRKDDWSAYYNLGNFYSSSGDYKNALSAYNTSIRIFPEAIMPMVNAGYLYSLQGDVPRAERMFELALSYEPDNEAALLNMALLFGETGRQELAIAYLEKLLQISEKNAVAAYNLGIILAEKDSEESLRLIKQAYKQETNNGKYVYTYAYYLAKAELFEEAREVLTQSISVIPAYPDSYILLSDIEMRSGNAKAAADILRNALENTAISDIHKQRISILLSSLESSTE